MSGFSNSIIGGAQKLIRKAIQSPNYVAGSAGWTVNKDGSAEFANLIARGTVTVQNGQGVFVYFGTPAAGTLIAALASANGTDPYGNTYMQGLYLAGYSSGGIANGISLQPKNVTVAGVPTTFTAGEIFTETFPTGECQTWITSPYDTSKGANASAILMHGSDATNGGTDSLTLNTTATQVTGTLTGSRIAGSVSVSFTSLTSFTQNVAFSLAFATVPAVMVNINSGAGAAAHWDARAINVTTTGFTLFVFAPTGATAVTWAAIPVQWIAIGT